MAENDTATFVTWDYVVLGVLLVVSAGIGVYYRFTGGRQKTTQVSTTSPVSVSAGLSRLFQPSFIELLFYV
jgi:hypothetical protein